MFLNDIFRSMARRNSTRRRTVNHAKAPQIVESLENRQLLTLLGMVAEVSQTFDSNSSTSSATSPPVVVADNASDPELTSFAQTFDIDIDANSISMDFNYTGPAFFDPSGTVPTGTVHEYTFTFLTTSNETISASVNEASTLTPTVSVVDGNTVVVRITEGMQLGDGQNALIDVDVNRASTSISGRKFHDTNRNGNFDDGEAWLSGWQVQLLDINQNSTVVDTAITDKDGRYEFSNVTASTYLVQEIVQEGWQQTTPTTPDGVAAFTFDRELNLRQAQSEFFNWGGQQERWLFGNGSWYFITPNGEFYQWNGSPSSNLSGELLHDFDAAYYNDITRLTNAPSPRRHIVDIDNEIPQTFRNLHFGNYFAPPEFTYVTNGDNTVTFEWDAVIEHTYDLWISNLGTRTRVAVPAELAGGTYTTAELPDGRYRAWLQSKNSSDVLSAWTRGFDFEFTRDALDSPVIDGLDAGIDRTPTIDIAPVSGAVSYDVRIANESGRVVYQGTGDASHRVTRELPLGTYGVSVRANFADGSRNAFSAAQTLTIDGRPAVSYFAGTLAWSPINAATEYDIWIDRLDAQGNRTDIQVVRIEDLRETVYSPNLPKGDYAVWVRAIRSEAGVRHASFWSYRVDFRVTELSPQNDETQFTGENPLPASTSLLDEVSHQTEQANATERRAAPETKAVAERHAQDSVTTVMMEIATSGMMQS